MKSLSFRFNKFNQYLYLSVLAILLNKGRSLSLYGDISMLLYINRNKIVKSLIEHNVDNKHMID